MSPISLTRDASWDTFIKALNDKALSTKQMGSLKISVVAGAPYSGFVDQGTRYMQAQPFFENNVNEFFNRFPQEMQPEPTVDKLKQFHRRLAEKIKMDAAVDTGFMQSEVRVQEGGIV